MNVLFVFGAAGPESISAGPSLTDAVFFLSPSKTAVFFHSHHHTPNATSPTRTSTPMPTPTPTATTLTPPPSPPPDAATDAPPVVEGVPVSPFPFEAVVADVLAVFDAVVAAFDVVVVVKSAFLMVKYADDTLGAGTIPCAAASVPLKIQKKNSSDWARSKPYSWTVQRNDVCGGVEACLAARDQYPGSRRGRRGECTQEDGPEVGAPAAGKLLPQRDGIRGKDGRV